MTLWCQFQIVLGAEVPRLKDYVITYEPYLSDPSGFPKVQVR